MVGLIRRKDEEVGLVCGEGWERWFSLWGKLRKVVKFVEMNRKGGLVWG